MSPHQRIPGPWTDAEPPDGRLCSVQSRFHRLRTAAACDPMPEPSYGWPPAGGWSPQVGSDGRTPPAIAAGVRIDSASSATTDRPIKGTRPHLPLAAAHRSRSGCATDGYPAEPGITTRTPLAGFGRSPQQRPTRDRRGGCLGRDRRHPGKCSAWLLHASRRPRRDRGLALRPGSALVHHRAAPRPMRKPSCWRSHSSDTAEA